MMMIKPTENRTETTARRRPKREELALVEWTRVSREIEALEGAERTESEQGVLTALRMCRAYLEQQLSRLGWTRELDRWEPPRA